MLPLAPQSEASLANGVNGLSVSPSAADLAAAGPSRTVTGVLSSKPMSRDIKIDSFSMGLNGIELIQVLTKGLACGQFVPAIEPYM